MILKTLKFYIANIIKWIVEASVTSLFPGVYFRNPPRDFSPPYSDENKWHAKQVIAYINIVFVAYLSNIPVCALYIFPLDFNLVMSKKNPRPIISQTVIVILIVAIQTRMHFVLLFLPLEWHCWMTPLWFRAIVRKSGATNEMFDSPYACMHSYMGYIIGRVYC